ncbi:MAG: tetratricopeptide (TPR) repeat protein [Granulosicoccus sp.]|jgi:tetratricopeptide (TPR) repeat protein
MIRSQYLFLLIPICIVLNSCSGGIDSKAEWKVYSESKVRNDYSTAVGALNRILSVEANNAMAYDSLAILYSRAGLDRSAAITAEQGLKLHETETLVQILAISNKNLGNPKKSLNAYLRLMEMRPGDLVTPYEIAFAYINIEQLDQAQKYIDLVIEHDQSATTSMTEFVNDLRQQVPFKAVALNMRGFVRMQTGAHQKAAEAYQEALNVFPDYQLALNNLRYLAAQAAETSGKE